jgi:hypothetical protein
MRRRSQPTKPTIHLIAEDKTGEFVFEEIVRKKALDVHIIPYGDAVGVSTLARQVKGLIATALRASSARDCIVVLHDTDIAVETYREHYLRIKQICDAYGNRVTRLEAIQEIESWLLADEGFCHWLGESPKASDHVPQPSQKLEKLINDKRKPKWNNVNKPKILQHMDVTGDKLSESMRTAMQIFLELPCTASLSRGASAPGPRAD